MSGNLKNFYIFPEKHPFSSAMLNFPRNTISEVYECSYLHSKSETHKHTHHLWRLQTKKSEIAEQAF